MKIRVGFKNGLIRRINRRTEEELSVFVNFGSKNNRALDSACAVFVALGNILQHYKGPLFNLSITFLIVFCPYILIKIFRTKKFRMTNLVAVAGAIMFFLYRIIAHGTTLTEVVQNGILIVYYLGLSFECINVRTIIKTALCVARIASVLIILQTLVYYTTGVHIKLVPTSLLADWAQQWVVHANTGRSSITGKITSFYRPCAFFLEPSHMFTYFIPLIFILLLCPPVSKWRIRTAALLTVGLFCSTSGMGMVSSVAVWCGYFLCKNHGTALKFRLRNILRVSNMLALFAGIFLLLILYLTVPFIKTNIDRIFVARNSTNAIEGRTNGGTELISQMKPSQYLTGVADSYSSSKSISSFYEVFYEYGIIGVLLVDWVYLYCAVKSRFAYSTMALFFLVMSLFSAHTHGMFCMLYYSAILLNGRNTQPLTLEPVETGPYMKKAVTVK